MQKTFLLAAGLMLFKSALPQQIDLDNFNLHRQKINKKGMFAIGGWSAANILYGSIAASRTRGSTVYFNRMNAIWNAVTFGISTIGYFTSKKEDGLTFRQSLNRQTSIEKIFLANTLLDAVYVAGGLYLQERAHNTIQNGEKLKGYGQSIVLQGSVLFLFDGLMYILHTHHGKLMYNFAEKVKFASTENGLGVILKL
ncbi:MAG: hypothetical protein M3040_08825 [Bacteroidota bacterium]|nr:hypothetical protein [Bacteroidota bacterium]